MTTTSDKAHRIASMIRALDEENPHRLGPVLDNYHDVLTTWDTHVHVSEDREDYPRLVELERELSILLGEPEVPFRAPYPWEIDEMEKFLPVLFAGRDKLSPCNIKTVDTSKDAERFQLQLATREAGVNGVTVIARDHLGEDVKFRIKVERS